MTDRWGRWLVRKGYITQDYLDEMDRKRREAPSRPGMPMRGVWIGLAIVAPFWAGCIWALTR